MAGKSQISWHWVGPCASVLCAIHCFGTGLIAALAPGLLKLLPHTALAEWSVWIVATGSGLLTLVRQKAIRPLLQVFLVASSASAAALAVHSHPIFHLGLVILGGLPASLLVFRHFAERNKPACCEHDHP